MTPLPQIHFIITGGTIDRVNDEKGLYPTASEAKTYVETRIKPYFGTRYTIPFLKDSLSLTEDDRREILKLVQGSDDKCFVISHGTDSMIATAQLLKQHIKDKVVILTGAFYFLSDVLSDGSFNLGFACAAALYEKPGIYIAMNGCLFDPDSVQKNHNSKRFEER